MKNYFLAIVNLVTVISLSGQVNISYTAINQLASATYSNGIHINYSYDKLGNRTGQTIVTFGCSKIVTTLDNEGTGSLRASIACAQELDTIQIAAFLQNSTLELESPTITIDKELFIQVPSSYNITFSNKDQGNTDVLLNIQDNLWIEGLKIIGKTDDSMIFKVDAGGSLNLKNVEMEKVEIQKE